MNRGCPICNHSDADVKNKNEIFEIRCPRCGKAEFTRVAIFNLGNESLDESDKKLKLQYAIRRRMLRERDLIPTPLTWANITSIFETPLPRPKEQADLLVRYIAESPLPGHEPWHIMRQICRQDSTEYLRIFSPDYDSALIGGSSLRFQKVIEYLKNKKLIEEINSSTGLKLALTLEGWMYYEEIKRYGRSYNRGFMAMAFSDEPYDSIFSSTFKPAAADAGFELLKLDDNLRAGLIDNQLRVEIESSDFVIADLTHDNNGAYWEAGYAEGLGKPVIYTCEKGKFDDMKTHFDTSHSFTIVWAHDQLEKVKIELTSKLKITLPHLAKL